MDRSAPSGRKAPVHSLVATMLAVAFAPPILSAAPKQIRVMTYNTALSTRQDAEGDLIEALSGSSDINARRVAQIIQHLAPDILFLNEFDYDEGGEALRLFQENYLAVSQGGETPITYAHRFSAPSNTGIPSGFDLDNNGQVVTTPGDRNYGNDCFGFGEYPGRYGMAVYSQFPLAPDGIRTFQGFLWQDMPGNVIPDNWYSAEELDVFRLSSKSHWDLPLDVGGALVHLLLSHPTPPVFDGPEDRNGRRNHDEIRFWADYLSERPGDSAYIRDDNGESGGLDPGRRFIVMGDLNADPDEGDSFAQAAEQILDHPAVNAMPAPVSAANGDDTARFNGGLRVDYVLPSKAGFEIAEAKVFWPSAGEPLASSVAAASDHRPVVLDLLLLPLIAEAVRDLEVTRTPDEMLRFEWKVQPGVSYRISFTPTLDEDSVWSSEPPVEIAVDGDRATALDLINERTKRYYRIEAWFSP